jgi:DNA polymerase III alpha subunit
LEFGNNVLPEFPTGELTPDEYLRQQAEQKLEQRLRKNS